MKNKSIFEYFININKFLNLAQNFNIYNLLAWIDFFIISKHIILNTFIYNNNLYLYINIYKLIILFIYIIIYI